MAIYAVGGQGVDKQSPTVSYLTGASKKTPHSYPSDALAHHALLSTEQDIP